MKILFAGSPDTALPALRAVAKFADELAVLSQPDRPVGRRRQVTPTPVSEWAMDKQVPLFRPDDHLGIAEAVRSFRPDLAITVAYGRILTPEVLGIPHHGWWNVHFSLLPRWRGATPVQHALLAGDEETGVSVFRLDDGVDTGPLLNQVTHPIRQGITAGELLDELSNVGTTALLETLQTLQSGRLREKSQDGDVTLAPKLEREEGKISAGATALEAWRRYQATTPEPGCFVEDRASGNTIRLLELQGNSFSHDRPRGVIDVLDNQVCVFLDGGILRLTRVLPAGKKPMDAMDWWRGVAGPVVIND